MVDQAGHGPGASRVRRPVISVGDTGLVIRPPKWAGAHVRVTGTGEEIRRRGDPPVPCLTVRSTRNYGVVYDGAVIRIWARDFLPDHG